MSGKALVLSFALMLAAASPAFPQQAPPSSERAKHVEALVNAAAALINTEGEAAFADFRKKDGVWFHGDTYLFVYDLKANVLLTASFTFLTSRARGLQQHAPSNGARAA